MLLASIIAQVATEPTTAAVAIAGLAGAGNFALWLRFEHRMTKLETELKGLRREMALTIRSAETCEND